MSVFLRLVRRYVGLIGVAVVTVGWSVLLVSDGMPGLRGPLQWRWPYEAASAPLRVIACGLVVVLYLVLALYLLRQAEMCEDERGRRGRYAGVVIWAFVGVPLIQLVVIYLRHPDVLRELFDRTASLHSGGYFSAIVEVEDINAYLRRFPELMPTFPIHPKRHPPGIPLMFWLARQAFALAPGLAHRAALPLRGFQCDNLWLQYLSDPQIASAWVSIILPVLAGLTVWPLYRLGRYLLDERRAAFAVIFYPLIPSVGLFATMWDQFIPLLTTLALLWFMRGLEERRLGLLLAAGLAISLGTFFNLGVVVSLAVLGSYAVFWHIARRPFDWGRILLEGGAFVIGLSGVWVIYWLFWGVTLLDIWQVAMSFHLKMDRSYWIWVFYHLYDFLVFLGIPLAVLLMLALARALLGEGKKSLRLLTLAFALGLLVIDLSGTSRGEVARVWLFLMPWALPVAVAGFRGEERSERGRWTVLVWAALLSIQLFAAAVSLRVIHTRYKESSRPAPVVAMLPAQARSVSAQFGDGIELLGYQAERAADPVSGIRIVLYWRAEEPIGWPWTVFRHVVVDGQLVGQRDSHPARGAWPTTCWRPGEIVVDDQVIPVGVDELDEAVLRVGFYDGLSRERLSVSGPSLSPGGGMLELRVFEAVQ